MIPEPPLWSYLLLEQPWPLAIAMLGLAVVLLVLGVRLQRGWFQIAAGVALLLAVVVVGVAWSVTTEREAVWHRTEALVAATAPLDQQVIDGTIQPTAEVVLLHGPTLGEFQQFRSALNRSKIDSQTIRNIEAGVEGEERAVTSVSVVTMLSQPAVGRPIPSQWRLHWQRDGGEWQVSEIVLTSWQGRPPHRAAKQTIERWLNRK
jgi:ABC-type transport system involved in cytochrome bd biosynthesis fused ATPase/permease subunit